MLQARRGLELNSLGASILPALRASDTANQPPGSLNVTGGAAHALAVVGHAARARGDRRRRVRIRARAVARRARRRSGRRLRRVRQVFSAQYVDWLVPLAPLAGLGASAVTIVILVLTRLVFSHRTALAQDHDVPLLLLRDLLVVVLFVVLLKRGSGTAPRGQTPKRV